MKNTHLVSAIRRLEERVTKLLSRGQGQRNRIAMVEFEQTGRLPDDPAARQWIKRIQASMAEIEGMHVLADETAMQNE